ncbi:hypothetical protein FKM82_029877 [Ascaphus truei]
MGGPPYRCECRPSNLVCAVSLFAAGRTLQVHRAAAAGFLLQGLASAFGTACFLLPALHSDIDTLLHSGIWTAAVIGLPLLAFAFFWLNGDHSTANVILGTALLLAAGSGYLTRESRGMAAHAANAAASLSIVVVSIFTGNGYGIMGSVVLGTVGLMSSLKAERILLLPKVVACNYVVAAAFLAFACALRSHHCDAL